MSLFGKKKIVRTKVQLVTERGNGFYAWDGKLYQSDIVRACIRPKVKAIGKLAAKHIRETVAAGEKSLVVNPDAYIRFLLEEPNPMMTGQKMQEKLAAQLCLNNNAFALILRDEFGFAREMYPITATSVEAIYGVDGTLYLKFYLQNGKCYTFPYSDVIHLRQDFYENDLFGEPIAPAITPLMNIISTTDQGVVKAIKNSNTLRWLLNFTGLLRPEDKRAQIDDFTKAFLLVEGEGTGVAATDQRCEAIQLKPNDFVPNAAQMDRTTQRIHSFFNTNSKIVQSDYTEDEWNGYYEPEVEPAAIELGNEYSRKIFSRRERGFGNRIVFDASNLQCASIGTKINLLQMVDRGAMTPNEWRAILNLAPVPGGDKPVRRLDTAVVEPERKKAANDF